MNKWEPNAEAVAKWASTEQTRDIRKSHRVRARALIKRQLFPCRGCGRSIWLARTAKGKRFPVDALRHVDDVVIGPDGSMEIWGYGALHKCDEPTPLEIAREHHRELFTEFIFGRSRFDGEDADMATRTNAWNTDPEALEAKARFQDEKERAGMYPTEVLGFGFPREIEPSKEHVEV